MKMLKTLTCAAAIALLCLTATAGFATNVLTNPGFETGDLTGWQVFGLGANSSVTVVTDNGPSQGGTRCVYMDNHAEALGLTMKQTTAPGTGAPGLVYWSFDLKAGQAAVGGVFFCRSSPSRRPAASSPRPASWATTRPPAGTTTPGRSWPRPPRAS